MWIFRWNSPAYGRIMKDFYPSDRYMREHRLYGLVLGNVFIGVIVIHGTD